MNPSHPLPPLSAVTHGNIRNAIKIVARETCNVYNLFASHLLPDATGTNTSPPLGIIDPLNNELTSAANNITKLLASILTSLDLIRRIKEGNDVNDTAFLLKDELTKTISNDNKPLRDLLITNLTDEKLKASLRKKMKKNTSFDFESYVDLI